MNIKVFAGTVGAFAAGCLLTCAQSQSVLDLLRSIQSGDATAAQPTPAPTPAAPAPAAAPATPPPALDTKPAFISILTNSVRVTNVVIVTNYVVVTNYTFTTNFYNAQGQLLMPLQPLPPGAVALADNKTNAPAAPDPAVVRSIRLQAVRELLLQAVNTTSNQLAAPGGFANSADYQIRIPDGVTVFDRKKGQTLTTALNTAAERAMPATCALLQKTVSQLNPPDPAALLQGDPDAATKFLLSSEGQNLSNQVLGIVQSTATDARVPEAYNAVMLRGGGLLGAVLGTAPSVDMNAHVTRGVMQAVFLSLSAQEKLIRSDPSARKTKALQDAFAK